MACARRRCGAGHCPAVAPHPAHQRKAILFTADGMRQNFVARYATEGDLPTMGREIGGHIPPREEGLEVGAAR